MAPVPIATGFKPPAGTSLFTVDSHSQTPTIEQYNLNVQRQLTKSSVLEVGYFGSHGYHLSKRYNFNICSSASDYLYIASRRPFPSYGYVFVTGTRGYLHYDALQKPI